MSKSVKQYIWQILTIMTRMIPRRLLRLLGDLAFESQQSKKNAGRGLVVLLEIQTRLRWYIDQQAMNYSGGIHPKHRLMDYHGFFKERIRPDDTVLDIGCGYGALAYSMAETGAEVLGVDINADNLAQAKAQFSGENITYLHCDVTREPPDGVYSVIVMSNVLEHLENRCELLCSLVETYSPRTLLLRVPMINRHWDVPLRQELGLAHFLDPTHTIEYTFASFENEMHKVHLKIVDHTIAWGEIWAEVAKGD